MYTPAPDAWNTNPLPLVADTTGAIFGQIAGAYYGVCGIPQEWCDCFHRGGEIVAMAEQLADLLGIDD